MDEKALLEAIDQMMDAKLKPISERLDSMEDKLDGLCAKSMFDKSMEEKRKSLEPLGL